MLKTIIVLSGVVALGAGLPNGAAGTPSTAKGTPRIIAKPKRVMVNQTVALKGRGFPKNKQITLSECSQTSWVSSEHPCLETNEVSVKTNRAGAFTTSLKAQICEPPSNSGAADAARAKGPTERACYVGEIEPDGANTRVLAGAAKIEVSWP